MMKLKSRKGFTLVEIMIVVAIIGLLAAIAIPNFVKARTTAQMNACIANLKQIDGAKQIFAIDANKTDTNTPTWGNLVSDYIKRQPTCQSGGSYTIGTVGTIPACSTATHNL